MLSRPQRPPTVTPWEKYTRGARSLERGKIKAHGERSRLFPLPIVSRAPVFSLQRSCSRFFLWRLLTGASAEEKGSHGSSSPRLSLFFYQINKSIQSPHNQSGCIISIAMWACSAVRHPLAHTRVTSQNTVAALGHAHRRAPYVSANCSLNVASSLLCRSPTLLLISTQGSETRATFSSFASILSISKRTEGNKAKRTRKALPREGELGSPPPPPRKVCCF